MFHEFFSDMSDRPFQSEVCWQKYRKRLLKYREKLFVFLDYDDVPCGITATMSTLSSTTPNTE